MKKIIFLTIAVSFWGLSVAMAQSVKHSQGYCKVTVVNPIGSGGCCSPSGNITGFFKWVNATSTIKSAYYGGPYGFTVSVNSDVVGSGDVTYQRIGIVPNFPHSGVSDAHTVEFDHAVEEMGISPLSCCPSYTDPDLPPVTY